ncbi:hypothetical protein CLV78_101113 [Aliiruegeria haliotis]|uniref:Uncharacterized protein n=1 Tax=Aliiruegeria haliotis TaxID=1280846 RepID=A0A2T0RXZ1_9RHOB|nr:hypothetical protein [Aliiruegeria haliotis]PRY26020.1 hypothetical protein CLV78_101113 [Aliiruegeria haliotis]
MFRTAVGILAFVLSTGPASAAWDLQQGSGAATTRFDGGRYDLQLSCRKGRGLELTLTDGTGRGDTFRDVRGLMLWFTMPDGRTDRWPVDVGASGATLSGRVVVSDFNLDFFRHGKGFRLDAPQTGTVFMEGDMKGTGAARLAFLEQCGI